MVQAIAVRAVADLVVILETEHALLEPDTGRVGPTWLIVVPRLLARVVPPLPSRGHDVLRRAVEVGEVAIGIAGRGAAYVMVKVVGPDAVEAPATSRTRTNQRVEISGVLGNDDHLAFEFISRGVDGVGQLHQKVARTVVRDRVCRVKAQSVDVVLVHPVQRILDEVRAHRARVRAVHVERRAPRIAVRGRVVERTERALPRAIGPEVVVDDVEVHGQAECVRAVDELPDVVGRAVAARGRKRRHAVVAPVPSSRKVGNRHDEHGRHAEVGQIRQPRRCRGERALGRERANVQFVEHRARERHATPRGVGPREAERIDDGRWSVDAERLRARSGIGEGPSAIEAVAIERAWRRVVDDDGVESVSVFRHRVNGVRHVG